MGRYISRGKEPVPFTVGSPDELFGQHREWVRSALQDELPQIIIYFPITNSAGMWGHQNPYASTTVCLTERSLLITRDYHNQQKPLIRKVPVENILCLEVGSAILLGWFRSILLISREHIEIIDILFNSRVLSLIRKMIKGWWMTLPLFSADLFSGEVNNPSLTSIPNFLKEFLLIDKLFLPKQVEGRGRKRSITAHPTNLYLSQRGIIMHIIESSLNPKEITFAESVMFWNPLVSGYVLRLQTTSSRIVVQFDKENHIIFSYPIYVTKNLDKELKEYLTDWNSILMNTKVGVL